MLGKETSIPVTLCFIAGTLQVTLVYATIAKKAPQALL